MIPIILCLPLFWVILLSTGCLGARLLQLASDGKWETPDPAYNHEDRLWLGLIFLVSLASITSLVYPIGSWVMVALVLVASVAGWPDTFAFLNAQRNSADRRRNWILLALLIGWGAVLVFVATEQTSHFDTGLYHAQMVKWNKQFGAVPGLANLHVRLGFNSAWDVFGALVDRSYFSGRSFHLVNLIIALIFLLACARGLRQWWNGDRSLSTIVRSLGLVVLLSGYQEVLSSLSTDWPSILLIYYAVVLTIELVEQTMQDGRRSSNEFRQKAAVLVAICFFAVTVKLSSIPILVLALVPFVLAMKRTRFVALTIVSGVLIIAPFVARNVVLSGCIVYPVPAADFLPVSWKVPHVDVVLEATLLKCWAVDPAVDWDRALDMTSIQRFRTWYQLRHDEIVPVIPWLCIGLAGWIGVGLAGNRRSSQFWLNNLICGIIATGLVFCFLTVREPRYAEGWILTFALVPAAWLFQLTAGRRVVGIRSWRLVGQLAMLLATLWLVRHAGLKRFFHNPEYTLLHLNYLPSSELKQVTSEHGLQVNTVVNDIRAWDAALPSTPEFNPALQLRGKTLAEGFVVTNPWVAELGKRYPRLLRLSNTD